ncbi:MAG: DNA-binding protein [Terriglobales bacterium]
MPSKSTVERAKKDLREGKSPTTAAGEFVHEEIEHVRREKHGARSPKQAIAIGLSKARRAGVPLPPPAPGRTSEKTRKSAQRAYQKGQAAPEEQPAPRYSRVREQVLKREPKSTVSRAALSQQARSVVRSRKQVTASTSRQARQRKAA